MHIMAIAYILVVPVWSKLPVLLVSESVLSVFSVLSAVYKWCIYEDSVCSNIELACNCLDSVYIQRLTAQQHYKVRDPTPAIGF